MNLSRRDLLRASLASPLSPRGDIKPCKTNVLMISVDDLSPRIACYGDPVAKTPNLDRLARHGVRFERAYCNYPLCNPSRASVLSGRRPENTRIHDNTLSARTFLGDSVAFLPEYFKAHGYFTGRIGKVAHFEKVVQWDISENDDLRRFGSGPPPNAPRPAFPDAGGREARPLRGGVGGIRWGANDNPDDKEPDGVTARRIARLITERKDKPFFIACGFRKPHLTWVVPRRYFEMYRLEDIHLPDTPPNDRADIPPTALICTNRDDLASDEQRRQAILGYYASASFMDAQLGIVLDTVDQHKLWDNTVVILWTDHGQHLYDHLQLWGKITQFEESAHVPLIVYAPGKAASVASRRLVESVDIYPSLTDFCGLPQAPGMDGVSFAPLMTNPQRPWKKAAYTMNWRGEDHFGRGVRTDRYRYTEWDESKAGVELYDHQTDPHEWTNLAGKPKLADVQAVLQILLRTGQKTNVPPA